MQVHIQAHWHTHTHSQQKKATKLSDAPTSNVPAWVWVCVSCLCLSVCVCQYVCVCVCKLHLSAIDVACCLWHMRVPAAAAAAPNSNNFNYVTHTPRWTLGHSSAQMKRNLPCSSSFSLLLSFFSWAFLENEKEIFLWDLVHRRLEWKWTKPEVGSDKCWHYIIYIFVLHAIAYILYSNLWDHGKL